MPILLDDINQRTKPNSKLLYKARKERLLSETCCEIFFIAKRRAELWWRSRCLPVQWTAVGIVNRIRQMATRKPTRVRETRRIDVNTRATLCYSADFAVVRVCPSVCVCYKPVLYRSGWTDRVEFLECMLLPALLHWAIHEEIRVGLYPKITVGSTSLRNFVLKSGLGKFRLSTGQYFCLSKNALADPRNVPSWYVLSMLPSELSFNYRPPNGSPLIDVAVAW